MVGVAPSLVPIPSFNWVRHFEWDKCYHKSYLHVSLAMQVAVVTGTWHSVLGPQIPHSWSRTVRPQHPVWMRSVEQTRTSLWVSYYISNWNQQVLVCRTSFGHQTMLIQYYTHTHHTHPLTHSPTHTHHTHSHTHTHTHHTDTHCILAHSHSLLTHIHSTQ